MKTFVSLLVAAMVLLAVNVQPTLAAPRAPQQTATAEQIKSQIVRLGVGIKAKATVRLNSGAKLKGYIAQAGDEDFVLRDRKTDAPTTIRYADVAKVDSNRGHSMARNVGIGVAIGVGAVIATLAIIFASLND
jgi:preprotein translocase subunit SecF